MGERKSGPVSSPLVWKRMPLRPVRGLYWWKPRRGKSRARVVAVFPRGKRLFCLDPWGSRRSWDAPIEAAERGIGWWAGPIPPPAEPEPARDDAGGA